MSLVGEFKKGIPGYNILFVGNYGVHHYFVEYIDSLTYWLKLLGYQVDLIFHLDSTLPSKLKAGTYKYIISIQTLLFDLSSTTDGKIDRKNIFVLNMEQYPVRHLDIIVHWLGQGVSVIDYSLGNIKILNDHTNSKYSNVIHYLPYLYYPTDGIFGGSNVNSNKTIPVVYTGTVTGHRNEKLHMLKQKGLNVIAANGFGKERDEQCVKSDVLLNLHAAKHYTIFEVLRCYRCIFNKMIIVSEDISHHEFLDDIDKYVIFCKDDQELSKKLKNVLENVQAYKDKIYPPNINHDYVFLTWSVKRIQEFSSKAFI